MLALPYNPYRKQLLTMAGGTWFVFGLILLLVRPMFVQNVGWRDSYLPFFVIWFLGAFWLGWGLTGRWKRSLLWSSIGLIAFWLRIHSLFTLINLGLLLAFGGVWEYYWHLCRPPETN